MSNPYEDKIDDIFQKWDQKQKEEKQTQEATQIHAQQTREKFPKVIIEIIKPAMTEACKKINEKGHSCDINESKDSIEIEIRPAGDHKYGPSDCSVTFRLWPSGEVSCHLFNGHHGDEEPVDLEVISKEMVWDKILSMMKAAFQ